LIPVHVQATEFLVQATNKWQWAKILDASGDKRGEDGPSCLSFHRDRLAIAYPRTGVKVWIFVKGKLERKKPINLAHPIGIAGTWIPQRSIVRQNVTTIKFVEDGDALIGGTTDGVLWVMVVLL
jgi:hypothetical protein